MTGLSLDIIGYYVDMWFDLIKKGDEFLRGKKYRLKLKTFCIMVKVQAA